jgi:hypothetical protein
MPHAAVNLDGGVNNVRLAINVLQFLSSNAQKIMALLYLIVKQLVDVVQNVSVIMIGLVINVKHAHYNAKMRANILKIVTNVVAKRGFLGIIASVVR